MTPCIRRCYPLRDKNLFRLLLEFCFRSTSIIIKTRNKEEKNIIVARRATIVLGFDIGTAAALLFSRSIPRSQDHSKNCFKRIWERLFDSAMSRQRERERERERKRERENYAERSSLVVNCAKSEITLRFLPSEPGRDIFA